MSRPLSIFLHSSRYDRLYQAVNLLLTASAMGRPCYLFLFHGALATFVAGTWDDTETLAREGDDAPAWAHALRRGFELSGSPGLYETLDMAVAETGGVTVCACSTSTRLLGLEPGRVRERVDEIIGMAAMLEIAEPGDLIYI